MDNSTLTDWLEGPTDLREEVVEDVPVEGKQVRVRGLPAAYANEAQSDATELRQVGRDQIITVNVAKLEVLQFAHGVVEPKFTVPQAEQVAQKYGPAFRKVIQRIDSLSALDKKAVAEAAARFPQGRESTEGGDVADAAGTRNGEPAVPARPGPAPRAPSG